MVARPGPVSRRAAAIAGRAGDVEALREMLRTGAGDVRATALAGLQRCTALRPEDVESALVDPESTVRRRLASLMASSASPLFNDDVVAALLDDADAAVCEVACFAAGERSPVGLRVIDRLTAIATGHSEALCRESAVAALGALGDERGRDAVLAACTDKATVRRRAVLALAAFDGDEVSAMLETMASDVDWQVRQGAEELLSIE